MLRALISGLALLHLGPGLAFALLAFGCDGIPPALGAHCEGAGFQFFMRLTLLAWLLLGALWGALACILRARAESAANAATLNWRGGALLLLSGAGLATGAGGQWLFGSDLGWMALPGLVVAGWLAVANPAHCTPAGPHAPPPGPGDRA